MRALPTFFIGLGLAATAIQPAAACTLRFVEYLMPLDANWRTAFREGFGEATGVYLVKVQAIGPFETGARRMACDTHEITPAPPEPSRPGPKAVAAHLAYTAAQRAAYRANRSCKPDTVRVRVLETLKGPRLAAWTETFTLIDVVTGPPREPVLFGDATPFYGRRPGNLMQWDCGSGGLVARRLSADATYLVFTREPTEPWIAPPRQIASAFWADPRAPFAAEARRLAGGR
jgi:hypothetical protein